MSLTRFADIAGHERPLGVLRRSVASGRVHHAYLFVGPAGVGKGMAARGLAALMHCAAPSGEGATLDACGACASCKKLAAGSHPDMLVVEPDGRFIKIDQVRELHTKTRFRPYESERRVVIVEAADTMREEAANALLKTLEEPRGDTMFVLVTSNPQKLLTTIVSRCQPLRFGALGPSDLADILAKRGLDEDTARVAARLGSGSVGNALHVLEAPAYESREDLGRRLAGLPAATTVSILNWAEELGRASADLPDVLDILRAFMRDAALSRAGADPGRRVNVDLADVIDGVAGARPVTELLGGLDRIEEAERMLGGNVNPRMVCEALLLALARTPDRPLADRLPA